MIFVIGAQLQAKNLEAALLLDQLKARKDHAGAAQGDRPWRP